MTTYKDSELVYAAFARCSCGAGLAYATTDKGEGTPFKGPSAWDCSDILTGRAVPSGQPGAKTHDEPAPFAFYKVKAEGQPSAQGATTRPLITYLVNVSSGVVHKLVDGRAYESDNLDQVTHKRVVPSIEDVGAVTKRSVRYCRRCFRERA